ncbi:MAG: hypothetical protein LBR55_00995 [Bacteroidales bacterium]|jgi:hypothetical protein|nr:hypothetical protein [Bacteroidales bacterium]
MQPIVSFSDIILSLFIIIGAISIVNNIYAKHIENQWNYAFYKKALYIRIAFSLLYVCVYTIYYDGGDSSYYFYGARSIVLLAQKDFGAAFRMLCGERTAELRSLFDTSTGYPVYFRDPNAWSVCRLMVPFYLLGFGSLWATTLILSICTFFLLWDFYRMLCKLYPHESKYMTIALFFLPSVLFWSSGILKDVWCFVAVLQLYKAVWLIFFRKHRIVANIFRYIVCAYILISIRPFVFYSVLIATTLWLVFWRLKTMQNKLLRTVAFPLILSASLLGIMIVLQSFGNVIEGRYADFDTMLQQVVVIQNDLTQDYYGKNSFNIGSFDASIPSMLSKTPIALVSGLFRPFLWEGSSVFLKISALEATLILLFFVYICIKTRIIGLFKIIINDSFLSSLCIFIVILAFFTGLSIANFGALVRYRIVYLPFFCIILFRAWSLTQRKTKREIQD